VICAAKPCKTSNACRKLAAIVGCAIAATCPHMGNAPAPMHAPVAVFVKPYQGVGVGAVNNRQTLFLCNYDVSVVRTLWCNCYRHFLLITTVFFLKFTSGVVETSVSIPRGRYLVSISTGEQSWQERERRRASFRQEGLKEYSIRAGTHFCHLQ